MNLKVLMGIVSPSANFMLLSEANQILNSAGYNLICEEFEKVTPEILDKVTQRVSDHITRVKHFYNVLLNSNMIPAEYKNTASVMKHDRDKLDPRNLKRQALRYCYTEEEMTPEIKHEINAVVQEHVTANKHHAEYWWSGDWKDKNQDCTSMPLEYIYEMMADWAATAEERGTSLIKWYTDGVVNVGGVHWKFTDGAAAEIAKCVNFLKDKIDPSMKRNYGLTQIASLTAMLAK